MTDEFVPTPNPYVKDEPEAQSLNGDVMALFRIGSLLLAAEHLQVPVIETTLRLLARNSREGVRALTWELCNVVREHAENEIDFPSTDASTCKCGKDHGPAVEQYNVFLANSKANLYQGSVDYIDSLVGHDVFEVLTSWAGVPCDHLGERRFNA